MNLILGADPGVGGALALYTPTTHAVELYDMPTMPNVRNGKGRKDIDEYALGMLIDKLHRLITKAYVEQVSARPGQAGQFQFGHNYGLLKGTLASFMIPIQYVPSSVWKPAMGLRKKSGQTHSQVKADARALASHLWPEMADEFKRGQDDGRAESALIAAYGAHTLKGQTCPK